MEVLDLQGEGRFGGRNPSQNMHLATYDSLGGSTDQRFRVLPNYFGHVFLGRRQ